MAVHYGIYGSVRRFGIFERLADRTLRNSEVESPASL